MSRHVTSYMSVYTRVQLTYCNIKLQFYYKEGGSFWQEQQNTEYLNKVPSGMYQTHLNCLHVYM